MKIKKPGLLILSIIILSISLNIYGIRWGLPSVNLNLRTYHPDEVGVLVSLQRMNPAKFDFNPHFFPWGTFHFYIVGIFLKFLALLHLVILSPSKEFYISHLKEMDKLYIYGRMISVLAQTGTVYLVYLLAKRLYSRKVALLSALFMSMMPLAVANAHYLKPNALGVFFVVWTALISSNLLENRNKKIYIIAGLLSGLATATKYNGIWAIFFPFLFHFAGFRSSERKKGLKDKNLLLILLFFAVGFFVGCPYAILSFAEFKAGIFRQMDKFILIQHGDIGNPFVYHIWYSLRYGMGTPLLVMALFSMVWVGVKREKEGIMLLFWVVSYYLFIASFFKSKFARHMLPLLPFFAVLVSRFFIYLWESRRKLIHLGGLFLAIIVTLYTFLYILSYDTLYLREDPRTQASHWIEKNIPPGRKIGVLEQPYFYTPPLVNMEYWVKGATLYNKGKPGKYNQYKIVVLKNASLKEITREKIAFIVVSEYEYRDALRFPSLFPRKKKLLDFIRDNYILVKKFENYQQIGRLRFRKGFPPHDWLYPYPAILIYKYDF